MGKGVGSSSVHPIYERNLWDEEEQSYADADDSTLLAVVRKPADIPAVAAFLIRDLIGLDSRMAQSL